MNTRQAALAAEVRSEMARRRITAAAVQRHLRVSSTAWSNWFVQCTRDVPLSVVDGVADYLGITTAELLRRRDLALKEDPVRAQLEAYLSPAALETVERVRAEVNQGAESPPNHETPGERRSA